MTRLPENVPSDSNVLPTFETVGEAALEISRLHQEIGAGAIDLTNAYYQQQMEGEYGVGWKVLPGITSEKSRRVPILGHALWYLGKLRLGASYGRYNDLYEDYALSQEPISTELEGGDLFSRPDALVVRKTNWGQRPDDQHIVAEERILRAKHSSHRPSFGFDEKGHTVDGVLQESLRNNYYELTEPDERLLKTIAELRKYQTS